MMAARTWPAGEAGPLGAQAGPCLCSEQGQPVTVGEGGRGQWVRHFQLVSHSHFGCVLPTWELGAGSQALGWPQVWHHPVSFPVSHFRLFLNKGLSSLKEHPSAHLGRPPSSARIHRDMAIWGGGSGGPCYLAAGSVAPEGWTPRLLPQGGAEVQPTSSEHSGPPEGGRLRKSALTLLSPGSQSPGGPGVGGTLETPPRSCPGRSVASSPTP